MRGHLFIIAIGTAGISTAALAADDEPICAARPGKSTPPCTVPAGHFQLETGLIDWSVQKDSGNRDTALVVGETTFKYGLTDRSDIEVDVTPWQRATSSGPGGHFHSSGFGDLTVAYKQQLARASAPIQFALQPVVKIPTANHSIGNGKWEGGVLLPVQFSIGKGALSIGLTPEFDWTADADGNGHHAGMAQVVSLGVAATKQLSLSVDLWGQWDWDPSGTTRQASVDADAAYLLSNDVQLDGGVNFGLNRSTPDVEVYAGISKRF